MAFRRPLIALSLVLVALLTIVLVVNRPPQVQLHPPASGTPPVALGSGLASAPAELPVSATLEGPAYSSTVKAPTRDQPASKTWFANGLWWAVLWSEAAAEFHIWWLDRGAQRWVDTGTLVDDRPYARQDAELVDGALVVVSGGTNAANARHAIRLLRFTFAGGTYTLDRGFPVQVSRTGGDAPSLAADPDGGLWICFVANGRVRVAYLAAGTSVATAPFILPGGPRAVVGAAQAAIVARSEGVMVVWSNVAESAVYAVAHRAGDDPDTWQAPEEALTKVPIADDHFGITDVAADDGEHLFVVLRTAIDQEASHSQEAPQIVLLERGPSDAWRAVAVGRIGDHHTHPAVAVDLAARQVVVVATSPVDGGSVYLKRSPLDHLAFGDGLGQPVLAGTSTARINYPTLPAAPFTAESGILVLAANDDDGGYRFALAGGTDAPPGIAPSTVVAQDLARPTFDGLAPGTNLLTLGWAAADESAAFLAATDPDGTMGAELRSSTGAGIRACTPLAPQATGTITATARVRIVGATTRNASVVALRGNGAELTGVRFMPKGIISWQDGATFVRGTATWTAGRWYVVSATVDLATRTWSFGVRADSSKGAIVASVAGLAWTKAGTGADEACVQLPAAPVGTTLELDALTVHRSLKGG